MEIGRLHFSTSLAEHIDNVTAIFIAVGTPPDEDGSADMQYVLGVAREIGQHLKKYAVIITKSTVPVGSSEKVKAAIYASMDARGTVTAYEP
jgi:UDPglucose 6-dehydrogenase